MFSKITLATFLSVAGLSAFSQATLVEKVVRKGNEVLIPYEKYKLPNGLTIIVHEDHSDPLVHVDVTYHVGSAREEIGKSGFAHFFEHMMFQGSDNVGDDQHFKMVSEAGGTLNGTTNRDRTNYFETLPANQLETALWLEADRMGFLLDAVSQKKFENQRETVKNERGQNYDNRPYGLSSEYSAKALYPYGHPYSWLTIGYIEDLNRVNVQDLKNFFLRWYGPNNATLTVGGDVKVEQVLQLANKYFGSIPSGPAVKKMELPAPVLSSDRYTSFEDNVRFPMLMMTFPTTPQGSKDELALDCLADIIGGGEYGILYKNFIKTQKGLQANSFNSTSELAGEFTFRILATPGNNLADMEKLVRESIAELQKRGISDAEVARFKNASEAAAINGLASVAGKVSQLASNETFFGNPNRIPAELAKIQALSKADVQRVFEQYLIGKKAVILSVVPKGKADLKAAADNFTVDQSAYKAGADEYKGLVYNKAKDNFDRSKKPVASANPAVTVPSVWQETLANGIKVIGTKNNETPTVALQLTMQGGHRLSATNPAKAGIAQLTAAMMDEATKKYSSEAFSDALENLGSSISIGSGNNEMTFTIQSLVKNLDKTLALAEEKLLNPLFAQEDFDRVKNQQLQGIANQNTQAVAIANKVFAKLLYGTDNIGAIPTSGTAESVKNITLDDVKAFYKQAISPANASLVIVGDIDQAAAMSKLGFMKKWSGTKTSIPVDKAYPSIDKTIIYLVDKENAPQSEIRIGYPALTYDATGDYYKAGLMNFPLGGAFSSRINLNLREDKGYTYGARSGFSGNKYNGIFSASAGVKGAATDSSVVEFLKELNNYRANGITNEELAFLKNSISQQDARSYETSFQKAGFLNRIVEYGLNKDYTLQQNEIINKITKADIDALAKKTLKENMIIVVVGDKKSVKPGLEKLGYEIVELDKEGNKLAK